jgi:pimeloyl-ACP methyl ester carboxylesterase
MQYETIGHGDPLILVPGGLTGWLSWMPHAEALAPSYKVTRVQLNNVALGLSGDPLPADYSVNYEVESLAHTVNELNITEAHFAAWSFGAETTLSYAIRNPNRARSLTLIEPPASWVLGSRGPLSDDLLAEREFQKSLAVDDLSEDQLVAFMDFAGLVPPGVDIRTLPQWPIWLKHRNSLRFGDAAFMHAESIERVRRFDKPVLLVKGDGPNTTDHAIIDILGEEFPNARVVTYPGGHAAHIVSMQPFMETYAQFLSEA